MSRALSHTPSVPLDLRDAVTRRFGLRLDTDVFAGWSHGGAAGEGLAGAEADPLRSLLPALTVGETFFHRWPAQLEVFAEAVRARPAPPRVLSAGCSTGEEAYTLAMILREVAPEAAGSVRVDAFDVNPAAIARARAGRYSRWSLRETPAEARDRWFSEADGGWRVAPSLHAMVRFEERNLVAEDEGFWRAGAWDVIFCRNVLMYLTPEAARAVVDRFARVLSPGGLLFLGHAESLRGAQGAFRLGLADDACYYVRTAPIDTAPPELPEEGTEPRAVAGRARLPGRRRERANDLLRQERFRDVLSLLAVDPDEGEEVLRAVAHLGAGAPAEAERVAAGVLRRGEAHAGAHCVLALCREHAGDVVSAMRHHHAAIRTDPAFAMPRFHLGRLARRAGNLPTARLELTRALALLSTEHPTRILHYGGGFGRDALLRLCGDELRACGLR